MSCGAGFLTITENLEAALRQLQQSDKPITLWVDAVCIDQTNLFERSEQVRSMGRIYHQAERVIVWLGPQSPLRDDQICIQAFNDVAALVSEQFLLPLSAEDRDAKIHRLDQQVEALLVSLTNGSEPPLKQFFRRRWFSRRWTIQELVLAYDVIVVCGRSTILWHNFESVLSELHHRYDWIVQKSCSPPVSVTIESLYYSRRPGT
jgi:hypothetical protein